MRDLHKIAPPLPSAAPKPRAPDPQVRRPPSSRSQRNGRWRPSTRFQQEGELRCLVETPLCTLPSAPDHAERDPASLVPAPGAAVQSATSHAESAALSASMKGPAAPFPPAPTGDSHLYLQQLTSLPLKSMTTQSPHVPKSGTTLLSTVSKETLAGQGALWGLETQPHILPPNPSCRTVASPLPSRTPSHRGCVTCPGPSPGCSED